MTAEVPSLLLGGHSFVGLRSLSPDCLPVAQLGRYLSDVRSQRSFLLDPMERQLTVTRRLQLARRRRKVTIRRSPFQAISFGLDATSESKTVVDELLKK